MKRAALLLIALALAGCDATLRRVKIAVPVACQVEMPEKPTWATEALPAGATLWEMARAALAELEQRRGYEAKLEAAAKACS